MMPFIHIGPVTLASFGLCVGIAMLVAYFVLARDIERRGIHAPADLLIAVPCIAGLIGAKLYHVFEDPRLLMANPHELISQYGFAWFGGFIGGVAAFVWMAHRYRVPLLEMFDAASPAAALGYGIGRIGCLVSGDGDYGKPTSLPWGMSFPHGLVPTTQKVHPTPIYELIVAIFIFWWLWKLGGKQAAANAELESQGVADSSKAMTTARSFVGKERLLRMTTKKKGEATTPPFAARLKTRKAQRSGGGTPAESTGLQRSEMGHPQNQAIAGVVAVPRGMVFAQYLILTGIARFLVEFIRINPRSFFGMTNAQTAALGSIIVGAILIWYLRRKKIVAAADSKNHAIHVP